MSEMLPCPFCGDDDPFIITSDDEGDDWYQVECRCGGGTAGSHIEEDAVEMWNRRPESKVGASDTTGKGE
jgi:Lar family restriction alleviation protein